MGKKRKKNKDQVPVFELTELREFIALDHRRAERGAGFHDDWELPSDLLSVAILDAAVPGSVSPELALKAFEYDRDALLRGIGTCQREVLAWDEVAVESGHPVDLGEVAASTQLLGPDDVTTVDAIQDGYTLTPLSKYGTTYTPPTPANPRATVTKHAPPSGLQFFDQLSVDTRAARCPGLVAPGATTAVLPDPLGERTLLNWFTGP